MDWNGKPYHSLDSYLKSLYGGKIYKLALNGGMTCPNRDGLIDTRGCIFCSKGGSGDFAASPALSVTEQIEAARHTVRNKTGAGPYIAYFQAYTNTYAPVSYLESIFMEAIRHPDIVGLSIATRPDCLPPDVLSLLDRLNRIKPVWVELGLQTAKETTAAFIRRGYELPVFEAALLSLGRLSIPAVIHVIFGLPGETKADMLDTIDYLGGWQIDGIKLQLLHVLKGTDLADLFLSGGFKTLTLGEYIDILISSLERLPPSVVIHRLTGDGPRDLLLAPEWSLHKRHVLNTLHKEMKLRNTCQGRLADEHRLCCERAKTRR